MSIVPYQSAHSARRNKLLLLAFVILVIVVSSTALSVAALLTPENNDVRILPDMGRRHVGVQVASDVYLSQPPTSGPHIAEEVAWGEHMATLSDSAQLHALERGGVILHYNCPAGCPEDVEALRGILNDAGTDRLLLHPYTNMDDRFAVTAWTRLLALDEVDRDLIVDFIEDYRGIVREG